MGFSRIVYQWQVTHDMPQRELRTSHHLTVAMDNKTESIMMWLTSHKYQKPENAIPIWCTYLLTLLDHHKTIQRAALIKHFHSTLPLHHQPQARSNIAKSSRKVLRLQYQLRYRPNDRDVNDVDASIGNGWWFYIPKRKNKVIINAKGYWLISLPFSDRPLKHCWQSCWLTTSRRQRGSGKIALQTRRFEETPMACDGLRLLRFWISQKQSVQIVIRMSWKLINIVTRQHNIYAKPFKRPTTRLPRHRRPRRKMLKPRQFITFQL